VSVETGAKSRQHTFSPLVTGLARTAIFALICYGKLKSVKEGKRRIIPKAAIQAYLDANVS